MIDYNKNTYVKIGNFTNVVNEIAKDQITDTNKNAPSFFHGFLDPLVDKLALMHPEWMLVGEDSWYNTHNNRFTVKRFRVYENGEDVGSVTYDDWKGEKFRIHNKRISNAMRKRSAMETKDLKKALKIIEDNFSSKTLIERIAEASSSVATATNNGTWRKRRAFDESASKVIPAFMAYFMANPEQVRPILESYGAPSSALDRLAGDYTAWKDVNALSNAREANTGTTVILHQDRYILIRDADRNNPQTLTASQLPPEMSAKIGVLKIIDGDEQTIESIGMRVNATTFYLLP